MGRSGRSLVILDDGWAWRTRLLRRFAEEKKLEDPICNQNMKSAVQWAELQNSKIIFVSEIQNQDEKDASSWECNARV